ncbi:heavy-metal-associated domain-containing protein [Mycolicibacterium lutetiense]|uniref:Copper chaperone CopZ n=1 Tax=Mycolicibacterium lutetiense TaxID=1641992 RepID=A0ABS4ZS61_9MYCO|nr:heavy metal-associated domain-containing protein [Mycolicibacterium lutetiense]MBP2452347.1 copper chaperone CopZ [Mycolicibacterium lutetiense]
MTVSEYQVSGMTCGHCEQSVREEVTGLDGVTQIEVSAATGRLVVTSAAPLADEAIVAAVKAAGYEAVRATESPTPSTSPASSCGCC